MFDKHPLEMTLEDRLPAGLGGRCYGVYPATVSDVVDPDGLGRVKVKLPWAKDPAGGAYEAWARLATLMGGNRRGSFFVPDIADEVLVAFEDGDPRRPFVLGGLWNGSDKPPEDMDGDGKNHKKVLKSRNGVKVTLDDTDGHEKLILETPAGQKITLQDGPGSVEIKDSNGNSLKMESSGVTITAAAKLTISAAKIDVSTGLLSVDAGMSKFSGVIKTDTVIATAVVGSSYTPGAGNIL
ncbi:phage baseplate assembly protein V [Sorangium sp. So ce1151]|uniref:phage baseplate assembly protein V n=1 Tax=Sorangium sp. So ce1151 TaxID=3133332 RepID=UPI003F5F7B24